LVQESTETYAPISNFLYGLKSSDARRQYPARLKVFLDFIGLKGALIEQASIFLDKSKDLTWVQSSIMRFIEFQKERSKNGQIAVGTIRNYYKAIKLFADMNEIHLSWKKITKGLPKSRNASNDRIPNMEEIKKLMEYPDRRIKPIIYTIISSGIRLGAWDYLQWKHIMPCYNHDNDKQVIAAKILVYAGENEEYYSFITPSAYYALKDWLDFRASYGEKISPESWLMRDLWRTTNIEYGAKLGLAKQPQKLKSSGIKRLIERALWEQGIRMPLQNGQKRHEWKANHGFRKMFKTVAEQYMRPINVEILMGHNIGVSASYYRPKVHEVLEDYLRAADHLTLGGDKKLEKQISDLTKKQDEIELMKVKHAREMQQMDLKLESIMAMIRQNPKLASVKPEALKKKLK
jgi:hypothetical protein